MVIFPCVIQKLIKLANFSRRHLRSAQSHECFARESFYTDQYRRDTIFMHYLFNGLKQSCFQITFEKINLESLQNCEKVYAGSRSVSVCADNDQTCISAVFFMNYYCQSLIPLFTTFRNQTLSFCSFYLAPNLVDN